MCPPAKETPTPTTAQEPVHAGARMTLADNKCPGDSQNKLNTQNRANQCRDEKPCKIHARPSKQPVKAEQHNTTQGRQPQSISTIHPGRHCSTMQRGKNQPIMTSHKLL